MGLTIIDSLDTLLLVGLEEEYMEGRHWVANYLRMDRRQVSVSVCFSGSLPGSGPCHWQGLAPGDYGSDRNSPSLISLSGW